MSQISVFLRFRGEPVHPGFPGEVSVRGARRPATATTAAAAVRRAQTARVVVLRAVQPGSLYNVSCQTAQRTHG